MNEKDIKCVCVVSNIPSISLGYSLFITFIQYGYHGFWYFDLPNILFNGFGLHLRSSPKERLTIHLILRL